MKEKKTKITKLDIAKLILGSTAASGASSIVYYACKAYGPAPKSKLNKIVLTIGAFGLAGAAGAAAYKQIEQDLDVIDVFKAFCKGMKTGFDKAREKETEEQVEEDIQEEEEDAETEE